MDERHVLHFTFGPVQGFVAQARRVRDFWAGSYLLAYLSGLAMHAVEEGGGEIRFPAVRQDQLMQRIRGQVPSPAGRAQIGSLPNRFSATVSDLTAGQRAADALYAGWRRIAGAVWQMLRLDDAVRDRWDRQIESAWEISWVISTDGRAVDRRKNMRVHLLPDEPGEKCTLCGQRQELSGLGLGSPESRRAMREWWAGVRRSLGEQSHNLGPRERLCAICLVKRFFPLVAREAIGWAVQTNVPSTPYLAAADWLETLLRVDPAAAAGLYRVAREAGVPLTEASSRLPGLAEAAEAVDPALRNACRGLVSLDGKAFFVECIREQDEDLGLPLSGPQRDRLEAALRKAEERVGQAASPYYALLLLDGDNMGRLLGSDPREAQEDISLALGRFSGAVSQTVREHNGFLIYAGGDDVAALLPLSQAIPCARALRARYREAFAPLVPRVLPPREGTASAAITFAHMKAPLTAVIRETHQLLDGVAKDMAGRDAIACRVRTRSGPAVTWWSPWEALPEESWTLLTAPSSEGGARGAAAYSNSFIYKLRSLLEVLPQGGPEADPFPEETLAILVAEYLADRGQVWPQGMSLGERREAARRRILPLLNLCRVRQRLGTGEIVAKGFSANGALLVRFLTQKGV